MPLLLDSMFFCVGGVYECWRKLSKDWLTVGGKYSFMRTEMTKGVGFDKFWDAGGALTPEEAAKNIVDWVEKDFDIEKTGTFWAPRGTRDIGSWDRIMGKENAKEGPVQLPW